ncbi:MAG TPA: ankyrin repeat domain-containing protein [Candidatus Babeliales bacterium]|nr:ankyrin repeat domain-containing protein [Candidatus Babeliales bacterium]
MLSKNSFINSLLCAFLLSGFMPLFAMQRIQKMVQGKTKNIFDAIEKGRIESVKYWLDRGVDIESANALGRTPLMKAVESVDDAGLAIVQLLLDRGANIQATDRAGLTPLLLAVEYNRIKVVKELLARNARLDVVSKRGFTPLKILLIKSHKESILPLLQLLLDHGAKIDERYESGDTPLSQAIKNNRFDAVKFFLDRHADIEASNQGGKTPLMEAVLWGNTDIAELLLQRGANIEAQDMEGNTPLLLAAKQGILKSLQLLLDKKANIEAFNKQGETALASAVMWGRQESTALLLARGANPKVKTADGDSLLISAIRGDSPAIAKQLLEVGVDIQAQDAKGLTALQLAILGKSQNIIPMLLERGAFITEKDVRDILDLALFYSNENLLHALQMRGFKDVINTPDARGELLLTQSIMKNDSNRVVFLIKQGANPYAQDATGFDAFDYVQAQNRKTEIFKFFKEQFPQEMVHREQADGSRAQFVSIEGGVTPTEIHYAQFREIIEKKYENVLEDFVVQECIAKERIAYAQDNYVFYRAEPGKYRIYQYVIQEFDDLLRSFGKNKDSFVFTRFFKDAALEQTINEYIDTKPWAAHKIDPTKNVLLSTNIPLFGNVGTPGSCTWEYFKNNHEAETWIELDTLFKRVFNLYGFDTRYIDQELMPLQEGGLERMASLQQIIIPKKIVDDVAMLAAVGYCVPWPTVVDPSCWDPEALSADRYGNGTRGRHTRIGSIIDNYRIKQIPIDDAYQARIFMNAAYGLNPASGITFNVYTRLPKSDTRIEKLKAQVRAITDKMFGEWFADQVMRDDRPLTMTGEELRAVLKNYGNGNVDRQNAFFDAFRKRKEQSGEDRKYEADISEQEKGQAVAQVAARIAREDIRSGAREAHVKEIEKTATAASLKEYVPASIWQEYAQGHELAKEGMAVLYSNDCVRDAFYNARIAKKTSRVARIATYNVHLWKDAIGVDAYQDILNVIAQIQADILVLQEVLMFDEAQIKKDLAALGYVYPPTFAPMDRIGGVQFGNMIVSKYPFVKPPFRTTYAANARDDQRNFINAHIQLPNGSIISLYGTHLDVWDETGAVREKQVRELLEHVQKDPHENIVLAGDCNAVRRSDYEYEVAGKSVWDMQTEQFLKRVPARLRLQEVPTQALQNIERAGFKDCFTAAGIAGPKYTVWTGTIVDFIFCAQKWNLPIDGCYIYFTAASDHLPVIMDVRIVKTKFAKELERLARQKAEQVARSEELVHREKKRQMQEATEGEHEEKKWPQEGGREQQETQRAIEQDIEWNAALMGF